MNVLRMLTSRYIARAYLVPLDKTKRSIGMADRDVGDGTAESLILPKEDLNGWRKRWEEGRTAWHKTTVDPVLEVYTNHRATPYPFPSTN